VRLTAPDVVGLITGGQLVIALMDKCG